MIKKNNFLRKFSDIKDYDTVWFTEEVSHAICDCLYSKDSNLDNFLIVVQGQNDDFFSIHTEGVFFKKEKTTNFISYANISTLDVELDFSNKHAKLDATGITMSSASASDKHTINCTEKGLIYTIHRIINYGRLLSP